MYSEAVKFTKMMGCNTTLLLMVGRRKQEKKCTACDPVNLGTTFCVNYTLSNYMKI